MAWYYVDSISVANGASVVSVTGNVDLSQIKTGWAFYTGTTIAEVKSGTAPNGLGLSEITLEKPWEGVTVTAQKGLIVPTSGALLEALKGLEDTNAFAIATHKALSDIATLDADVTIKDSAGDEHTFASLPKSARLIQELVASVSTLESDFNSEATGEFSAVIASTSGKATGPKSAVIASLSSSVTGENSAAVASSSSQAGGSNSGIFAARFSHAMGGYSAVFASYYAKSTGNRSVVVASEGTSGNEVLAEGDKSFVAASYESEARGTSSMVLGSFYGKAHGSYSSVISSDSGLASGVRSTVLASSQGESLGTNTGVLGVSSSKASGNNATAISSLSCEAAGLAASVIAANASKANGEGNLVAAAVNSTSNGVRVALLAANNCTSISSSNTCLVSASANSKILGLASKSVLMATDSCEIESSNAAIVGGLNNKVSGNNSTISASNSCDIKVDSQLGAISASLLSEVSAASYGCSVRSSRYSNSGVVAYSDVVASRSVIGSEAYSLTMGYNANDTPSESNQSIRLEANGGVGRFSGGTTTTGFDYAEYFENLNDEIIPAGTIVTLENGKVRKTESGEFILGVVSKTYGVLGNSPDFHWHKRYMKDDWGGYLTEGVECINDEHETRVQDLGDYDRSDDTISITKTDVYQVQSKAVERWEEVEKEVQEIYVVSPAKVPFKEITATHTVLVKEPVSIVEIVEFILIDGVETALDGFEVIDNKVTITELKEYTVFTRQDKVENPDYEDKPYSSRGDRPNEYTIVGLLGQLFVTVYEDIDKPYVSADGLGCESETPLRAMRMSTPFDSKKGYGVCFCLKK